MARKKDASGDGKLPRLTSIPAARSSAAVLKTRLFLVLGALLLAAAAGVLSAVSWLTYSPPAVDLMGGQPRGQGLATIVAEAYLAGEAPPVPVAEGVPALPDSGIALPHGPVEWNGFQKGTIRGIPAEIHSFLFYRSESEGAGEARTLYQLDVLVSFTERGTAVLGALPSFQPYIATNSGNNTLETEQSEGDLSGSQKGALETWASAWASADSTALAAVAGSGPGWRYLGLGGFESTGVLVLAVTPWNRQASSADQTFVVRTRVSLRSANGFVTTMDMDVLLKGAGESRTYVTAWGPAGTGLPKQENVRVKE